MLTVVRSRCCGDTALVVRVNKGKTLEGILQNKISAQGDFDYKLLIKRIMIVPFFEKSSNLILPHQNSTICILADLVVLIKRTRQ